MNGITVTGNSQIDRATAEIAVALRNASPGKRDQHYYDEASRLRDEIMQGTMAMAGTPCDECGADIPDTEASMVSESHKDSCSLHPRNVQADSEPKPFSAESERLYDEYLADGARVDYTVWLRARFDNPRARA